PPWGSSDGTRSTGWKPLGPVARRGPPPAAGLRSMSGPRLILPQPPPRRIGRLRRAGETGGRASRRDRPTVRGDDRRRGGGVSADEAPRHPWSASERGGDDADAEPVTQPVTPQRRARSLAARQR